MSGTRTGHGGTPQGGIPDGLLVSVIALLLGLTLLVWETTGLAALLDRGSWPHGVDLPHTPLALRHLVTDPGDIAAAWPAVPPERLSGYGLFWGLLVGQLLALIVLCVFVVGTVTRWRAVRTMARAEARSRAAAQGRPHNGPARPGGEALGTASTGIGAALPDDRGFAQPGSAGTGAPGGTPPPNRGALGHAAYRPVAPGTAGSAPLPPLPPEPDGTGHSTSGGSTTAPEREVGTPRHGADAPVPQPPALLPHAATSAPTTDQNRPSAAPTAGPRTGATTGPGNSPAPGNRLYPDAFSFVNTPDPNSMTAPPDLFYGPAPERRTLAARAVLEAAGPVLVTTSDPALWAETKNARAKLGPVHVFDPGHLLDTPDRLRWSPTAGCEARDTAALRAAALLAPVRPRSPLDSATADTAETLLRCWLHAAAVDGRPFRQVHRWAQGSSAHEPVRILRTHPKAAAGAAGELESSLTGHPERRDVAQELTARALTSLSTVHMRDACNPNRADSLAWESFIAEGGTLYVVGEAIEDPRTRPGAMPLLTALVSSVVERGRCMAGRSSAGRLDPPLTLVLDDVAAVAPVPALPDLLAQGADQGLPTLALMRSEEQALARWPHRTFTRRPVR
ncbi:type VI secretion protein [Streptomyces gamaensis]|uniref:Type VI secretion protein n=1 Tax=Streptomyces gamaensis TaxID=1763542 RepID=A0ABW0Z7T7_9ACTN